MISLRRFPFTWHIVNTLSVPLHFGGATNDCDGVIGSHEAVPIVELLCLSWSMVELSC